MTLREAIETSLALFEKKPNADADEIRHDLTSVGVDADLAAKLVYFIPTALCRLVFGAAGVQFAPHYITIDDAGNETGTASFPDDPVYADALACCNRLLAHGEQAEPYRPLAARCADYKAIMELHLKQGAALRNLTLPPPRLNLPPGREPSPEVPRKDQKQEKNPAPSSEHMPDEAKAYMETAKAHFDRPFVKQFFYEVTLLEWNIPGQAPTSFWAMQFRDKANAALVWTDSSGNWCVGKWTPLAGKEAPIQVGPSYFNDCPSVRSFGEAVLLLEARREQQDMNKRPWYSRLWKRAE